MIDPQKQCPLQNQYGDVICIDGLLWGLTYGDCAPPDQRQCIGDCEYCKRKRAEQGEAK